MNHEHQMHHDNHECAHEGEAPMCSCDHNPGGECHCPPNECKCDQQHHKLGLVQEGHNCCETGGEHDHAGHGGVDHSMHAGHDHSGHAGHDHSGHDHSHHDPKMFKKQFWWALGLTVPTIYFSHTVHQLLGYPLWQFPLSEYVPALFGIILFMTGGQVFLKSGWQEIKGRKPGMMALIAMAIVVAFGYSLFLTVMSLAGIPFSGMDFWWELAALITIMLLGHWICLLYTSDAADE